MSAFSAINVETIHPSRRKREAVRVELWRAAPHGDNSGGFAVIVERDGAPAEQRITREFPHTPDGADEARKAFDLAVELLNAIL